MYKRRFPLLLVLAALILAGCSVPEQLGGAHQFTGTLIETAKPLADFTLPDQNGQQFQLSAQQPNLVLLYFGYTNCPDFCPATMGDWKQIKQELGADAAQVRFALVSVDPERDTPEALKSYVERFDPAFMGLRPTSEQVTAFGREYGFPVEIVQDAAGAHHHDPTRHGTYSYLVDRTGGLRMIFRYDIDPRAVVSDIRAVLAQR